MVFEISPDYLTYVDVKEGKLSISLHRFTVYDLIPILVPGKVCQTPVTTYRKVLVT